jgi:hypothetical protein
MHWFVWYARSTDEAGIVGAQHAHVRALGRKVYARRFLTNLHTRLVVTLGNLYVSVSMC